MMSHALMGKQQPRPLPTGLKYFQETFPEMSFSREFFDTLEEVESVRGTIFDISDEIKKGGQFLGSFPESLQSLKQWVTFIPPRKKNIFERFSSPICPSEATLLLMYAAATVTSAWMNFTSKDGPETCSQFVFKEMLNAQVFGKGSYFWKKSLKTQAQKDEFWQTNSDIFAVVDRLLT